MVQIQFELKMLLSKKPWEFGLQIGGNSTAMSPLGAPKPSATHQARNMQGLLQCTLAMLLVLNILVNSAQTHKILYIYMWSSVDIDNYYRFLEDVLHMKY